MDKELFCAKCQILTTHTAVVDANGEFIFTCQNIVESTDGNPPGQICGRFIKFPADISKEQFDVKVEEHAAINAGQVSIEAQETKLAELLSTEEPVNTDETEVVAEE